MHFRLLLLGLYKKLIEWKLKLLNLFFLKIGNQASFSRAVEILFLFLLGVMMPFEFWSERSDDDFMAQVCLRQNELKLLF